MLNIRKASILDIPTIQEIASITFPHTYNKILSPEQITYMMEWMYSSDSLHKQIVADGHIYYIFCEFSLSFTDTYTTSPSYITNLWDTFLYSKKKSTPFTYRNSIYSPPLKACI